MSNQKTTPSYGIILFTMSQDDDGEYTPHYLLAQRRDTIEYIDFFSPRCPLTRLPLWFSLMTFDERDRIKKHINDFDTLWFDLTLDHKFKNDRKYIEARDRFNKNKEMILNLLNTTKTFVREPSWGWPKGRKQKDESTMNCAFREFEEESGMSKAQTTLFFQEPVSEVFSGTNGKTYSTHYYVCETPSEIDIVYKRSSSKVSGREKTICHEIKDLAWLDFNRACRKLNPRRCNLLKEINDRIMAAKMPLSIPIPIPQTRDVNTRDVNTRDVNTRDVNTITTTTTTGSHGHDKANDSVGIKANDSVGSAEKEQWKCRKNAVQTFAVKAIDTVVSRQPPQNIDNSLGASETKSVHSDALKMHVKFKGTSN